MAGILVPSLLLKVWLYNRAHLEGEEFHTCLGRGVLDQGKESRESGAAFWGGGELLSVI